MERIYEMDTEYDIPEWAVCAIEYGDRSGLTEEDEKELDEWQLSLKKDGYVWNVVFTSDTDAFNRHPAFGLPCATCKATVVYYKKGE